MRLRAATTKTRIYKLNEMDADHVTAWSKGGDTALKNCQMLCAAQHSGQPLEKVAKDMERDYLMTAEEAVKYGLVDKVLARRFESDARPTA